MKGQQAMSSIVTSKDKQRRRKSIALFRIQGKQLNLFTLTQIEEQRDE
jgi:hypothetical protein